MEEFLDLRKNTGDDRRRTHDMNTANWITDLFMKRLEKGEKWTFSLHQMSPSFTIFTEKSLKLNITNMRRRQKLGKLNISKHLKPKTYGEKNLSMLFETGHPWVTFKDPCNIRSPQGHVEQYIHLIYVQR